MLYEEKIPEHSEIRLIEALNESIEELFDEPTVFLPVALERTPISLQTNSMKIDTQELSSSEEKTS